MSHYQRVCLQSRSLVTAVSAGFTILVLNKYQYQGPQSHPILRIKENVVIVLKTDELHALSVYMLTSDTYMKPKEGRHEYLVEQCCLLRYDAV
jgi:hypothetical protein